jgi:hypothetical protein
VERPRSTVKMWVWQYSLLKSIDLILKKSKQKTSKNGRIRGREDEDTVPYALLEKPTKLVNQTLDRTFEEADKASKEVDKDFWKRRKLVGGSRCSGGEGDETHSSPYRHVLKNGRRILEEREDNFIREIVVVVCLKVELLERAKILSIFSFSF